MGTLKELTYATSVKSVQELIARVSAVTGTIRLNLAMSERIETSMARRIQVCINIEGGHFEQLLL